MSTALWCLLAFACGMAAIPGARTAYELVASLRDHWRNLDFYDTPDRRRGTPPVGRAAHRVMRLLKRRAS